MRRIFNILAILISLTITAPYATYGQNSPSYDDKPPAYIWGTKTINPQTQGSGNKQDGNVQSVGGSIMGWDNENQMWRPISVDANGFLKSSGSAGAEQGSNPKIMAMKNYEISADSATVHKPFSPDSNNGAYNPDLALSGCTERVFVEIRASDIEAEFEVAVKIDTSTPNVFRKVKGRILLTLPAECNGYPVLVMIKSGSEALSYTATEGWR